MKKFGLDIKYINFIKEAIEKKINGVKIFIFGSRAKSVYNEYSDIDLALDYNSKPLELHLILELKTDLADSTLPYKIDLIDLNNINPEFKKLIINDLLEF